MIDLLYLLKLPPEGRNKLKPELRLLPNYSQGLSQNRCQTPPGPMPKMAKEAADYMMDYHTNLWEIPTLTNQARSLGHPAACPVELVYRCILAYSRPGDRVLDPFGGSGTTLVAAEKAGRTSVLIEVNPAFCNAIIHRWKKLFAKNE